MKKVLLVTVACLLASHTVQAQDDQVREAAPLGPQMKPTAPVLYLAFDDGTVTESDKPLVLREADPEKPAVTVDPEKATQGKEAARQNEEAGRPFWQLDVATSAHAWEQMEARPPMFVPHGPFMVAVDPDGTIVNSQRPMILYPKEFSAMAQETTPLTTPLPRSRPKKR